jgi:hypothetical protein
MARLRFLIFVASFLTLLAFGYLTPRTIQAQAQPNGTVPSESVYLPVIVAPLPTPPSGVYDAIPVAGRRPDNRPAALHGDLNLALRGYTETVASLMLVDYNGKTDPDAPQLAGLFDPPRLPEIVDAHQVYDWDWSCGPDGCRGQPLAEWDATLLSVDTAPGEPLLAPPRNPEIYGGGYRVMVLYAEATRLTLVYTRDDTAAGGYVLHLENIQVDAGLLALYETTDAAGRFMLPALRNGERLGYGTGGAMKIAIRDTGRFMDPRSRKDWWMGYLLVNAQESR